MKKVFLVLMIPFFSLFFACCGSKSDDQFRQQAEAIVKQLNADKEQLASTITSQQAQINQLMDKYHDVLAQCKGVTDALEKGSMPIITIFANKQASSDETKGLWAALLAQTQNNFDGNCKKNVLDFQNVLGTLLGNAMNTPQGQALEQDFYKAFFEKIVLAGILPGLGTLPPGAQAQTMEQLLALAPQASSQISSALSNNSSTSSSSALSSLLGQGVTAARNPSQVLAMAQTSSFSIPTASRSVASTLAASPSSASAAPASSSRGGLRTTRVSAPTRAGRMGAIELVY